MANGVTMLGGHKVERVSGKGSGPWEFHCADCDLTGDATLFTVGITGCPGEPESLSMLSVCPGGTACAGHLVQDSPEWRGWKENPSMSTDSIPRTWCEEKDRGVRAERHFREFAARLGMPVSNWTWNTETVFNVNAEAFTVAKFDHPKGRYYFTVEKSGKIKPIRRT